nr:hypothetical protein CFP56_76765 [Quercus suber]
MYETYLMELGYKGKTGATSLVKPGAKGELREDGQVCLRISNHKGWSVIGSALVLYLPSLALASEAVVAEVELELRAPGESPNPKKEDSYNLISYSLSLSLLNFKEEQGKKKSIPLAPKLFE